MTESQQTQKSVLLVDDDRFLLDMYSVKFTKEGFSVNSFLSVDEALAALRGGLKVDAIVFDLVMPGKDGFAFLEAVAKEKLDGNAVLIALTNQMEDQERAKTEELGAQKYIVKASIIPSEVVNIVAGEITRGKKA